MKKRVLMLLLAGCMTVSVMNGCGATQEKTSEANQEKEEVNADQEAADKVAKLIDEIYVQERTDKTDEQCKAAKEAWDALTDEQKEMVEGESADPDYFGRDTGDASKDDPLNADGIGEKELLVVSFGTSFNDSRAEDIGGIEKALQEANPDWSVRRAFTAQIIINHVQARDNEKIDNVEQALERAVANGVKHLVVQPTHLMRGHEYDDLVKAVEEYKDKFETVKISEVLLGEVGLDATVINEDKQAVAKAISDEAVKAAGYDSMEAADKDGVAFVYMGHGTSHTASVSYSQMQTQMDQLGYKDQFETVKISEVLLGEVGSDATVINEDKQAVAKAISDEALKAAGYDSMEAADKDGVAFVYMGHGTSHTASVSYSQMQTQMDQLGYKNVFIGTVEGEPEGTSCEDMIEKLEAAGYKKVILRPLMVVAGDHANNDMAGDDEDSWKSMLEASGKFESIETQISGLGQVKAIQNIYVAHAAKVIAE